MTVISTIEYHYLPRLSPRSILVFSGGYLVIFNNYSENIGVQVRFRILQC